MTDSCWNVFRWQELHERLKYQKVGYKTYVNEKYAAQPRRAQVKPKRKRRLILQCDEIWSFVGYRDNKVWLWLAMDAETREIVALHVGDRSRKGAQSLWENLPPIYRECAVCFTDDWEAYVGVLPETRHRIVEKASGLTSYIDGSTIHCASDLLV